MDMLKTMATQLIEHDRIRTTLVKARCVSVFTNKLVEMGKKGTRDAWLDAKAIVRTDRELHKLFTTIALRYRNRTTRYTRVIHAGFREKDSAPMAFVEFVDWEGELKPADPVPKVTPLKTPAALVYLEQLRKLRPGQSLEP